MTERERCDGEADLDAVREAVQNRVLWLSTAMVHAANSRPSTDGLKVGGHQASSASSVGILSALYLEVLKSGDRVAVKPHASPVFHALQYLLGRLDRSWLTSLRAFEGLQAYPSRTKDPDDVDISTGSVGLGVTATTYGALVRDYLSGHDLEPTSGRFFAHVGDAELDEGSVWETVAETVLSDVPESCWIVDLNRQSLDRVIPGVRVNRYRDMFRANGWEVVEAKYGRQLERVFAERGGEALRRRLDEMTNEEYQAIVFGPVEQVRGRLLDGCGPLATEVAQLMGDYDDAQLQSVLGDLAGHDIGALVGAVEQALEASGPSVVFAYTIKGWRLPTAGDPMNHSSLLTDAQVADLASTLGVSEDNWWNSFASGSAEHAYIRRAAGRTERSHHRVDPIDCSGLERLGTAASRSSSTQQAFGRILAEIDRAAPALGARLVTCSPDVATSTNLGSWINRSGVWSRNEQPDALEFSKRPLNWRESPDGRHIELGISETNLLLLLGQLGLSAELSGHRLVPIGTVYDPFVARALDPLIYALYQNSKFVLVGTPSGVTLGPEGGAHQSVITPSIGLELPGLIAYEPASVLDLEVILTHVVSEIACGQGESAYLRLSTLEVDQRLFEFDDESERSRRRRRIVDGCYRLRTAPDGVDERVNLFAVGVTVPAAVRAAEVLESEGIGANVFVVTSADLLFRRVHAATMTEVRSARRLTDPLGVFEFGEQRLPIVTVIDGHPHTLSFLGSAMGVRSANLGVDGFGQSGTSADLHAAFGIDAPSIVNAAIGVAASG